MIGGVAVEDENRLGSGEAVKALHNLGIQVAMVTGDSQAVADSIAKRLSIYDVAADVMPATRHWRFRSSGPAGREWRWLAMV